MRVVEIATGLHETERIVKLYREQLQADSAKCIRPVVGQNIEAATELVIFEESVTCFPDGSVGPKLLPNELLSHSTARSYSFIETTQRWTQSDQPTPSSLDDPLPNDVLAMISRLGDSEYCRAMVGWLRTARVSVKLSGECDEESKISEMELEMIGTPGNVLAIGRSGTGKTTCAALRVIGFMKLFRGWLRTQNHAESCLLDLHLTFVMASKVLTKKVRNFFNLQVSRLANPANRYSVGLTKHSTKSMKQLKHQDFPLFFSVAQLRDTC